MKKLILILMVAGLHLSCNKTPMLEKDYKGWQLTGLSWDHEVFSTNLVEFQLCNGKDYITVIGTDHLYEKYRVGDTIGIVPERERDARKLERWHKEIDKYLDSVR